ncbi:MAG: carboxypeptidase regulatory-like domain-containing protein [Acidobacteria bacterium]|nr:carboxypeptidase regulatory-like domain-containing protein [Acidobacteriota bacterium]
MLARLLLLSAILTSAVFAQAQGGQQGAKGNSGYGNWLPGSQKDKKGDDANTRAVTGTIRSADDKLVEGAIVQIKNTKTLQINSFITKADGVYTFQNLSASTDYEIKAESKGMISPVRTLSTFDDRKRAIIHLRLENKKQ